MKALKPITLSQLSPSEKKRIEQYYESEVDRRMMIVIDILLKMSCQSLNETEHMGEGRLLCYLGNFFRIFQFHSELVKQGTQIEYLDDKMRKIFRKNGYPDQLFQLIFGEEWVVNTNVSKKS